MPRSPVPAAQSPPVAALAHALAAAANPSGGWGYYARKASRIEPTAWALLALGQTGANVPLAPHTRFLTAAQQADGWLVEDPQWPVNVGFNALVAFAWFARPALATDAARGRLLAALLASKGIQVATVDPNGQDNSLQGWPWIDTTFSWVEPTAWGLVALKRARRAGVTSAASDARIAEAERLLINRVCRDGGWNFGNATALSQDLRAYVPTTAVGLLALQDRRGEDAVTRSLAFLEAHWPDEPSATSHGLTLICLDVYGRPTAGVEARLGRHVEGALSFGNLCGEAVALAALSGQGEANAFRL
jgi:hypothetical protein